MEKMENEKYLNKLQKEEKEKEEVSKMEKVMEETKKELGVNPEVGSKKELKRKLTKEKRRRRRDIKQQKKERKENIKEIQTIEKEKIKTMEIKTIEKIKKICEEGFQICKEGVKYLWNNHKVLTSFCLLSLILIILGYSYVIPTLMIFYGANLFAKFTLHLFYED
jgi:hypothetical protein